MPRICIGMSNFAQSAEVTLDAIKLALQAEPTLKDNAVVTLVRDGDTGKIVQVDVNLPANVAQADLDKAQAAIAANKGVGRSVVLPEFLFIFDLTNITFTGTMFGSHSMDVRPVDLNLVSGFVRLGSIIDAGQTYIDAGKNTGGLPLVFLSVTVNSTTNDLVVPPSSITLAFDSTTKLLTNSAPFTVPKTTLVSNFSFDQYVIGADGSMFLVKRAIDGVITISRTLSAAVAAGAL